MISVWYDFDGYVNIYELEETRKFWKKRNSLFYYPKLRIKNLFKYFTKN